MNERIKELADEAGFMDSWFPNPVMIVNENSKSSPS